jgi:hypothetical protein
VRDPMPGPLTASFHVWYSRYFSVETAESAAKLHKRHVDLFELGAVPVMNDKLNSGGQIFKTL